MQEKIVQIFNGHGTVGLAKGVSGAVYIWGWNRQGLLANGSTENSMVPQKLDIPSNVIDISSYDTHVIALCENGKVYSWGSNYFGELGDGSKIEFSPTGDLIENNRLFPKEVSIKGKIIDIAAARGASYALTEDGKLYAWGANDVGQLGVGDKDIRYSSTPMEVCIEGNIKEIAIGAFHAYALLENGDLYGWGYNSRENRDFSVLGIGKNDLVIYSPVKIPITGSVKTISTGSGHTFMRTEDGELYAWGSNYSSIISSDLPETVNVPTLLVS
jgi:alpha-tubulin suppressor-like RCC1 family protein